MNRVCRATMVGLLLMLLCVPVGCGNNTSTPPQTTTPSSDTSPPSSPSEPLNEERPQEATKERIYQSALTHLEEGNSVSAYKDFAALGDYKDSAHLKEVTFLQNQLNFLTYGAADWFRDNRESFALVPTHLVADTMGGHTWLVPNFQARGYLEYVLANDGTGEVIDPFLGQRFHDIAWSVPDEGFRIRYPNEITDEDHIAYPTEIRKAAEGVYIFYVVNATPPLNGSDIVAYIDKDSAFAQRYIKANEIIMNVIENPNTQWHIDQDPYGLYFIVQAYE